MFIVCYLVVASTFIALGLCLAISPRTYFSLLDQLARVDLWTRPSSSWNPKAPRWRMLGAAMALFGLFLILGPPVLVYLRSPEAISSHRFPSASGPSWGGLIVLAIFSLIGVGFLTKPLTVLNLVSTQKVSFESPRYEKLLRVFGGLLLVMSVVGICIQLLRCGHT